MTTPRDFTKRVLCPRCCKQVEGIHTCTPTPLVRELERDNATLRIALQKMVDQFGFGVVHPQGLVHDESAAIHAAMAALAAKEE